MYFALTDEQRALATTVRSFLSDRFGPERVRAGYDDPDDSGHPEDLWAACGEHGWLAITVPERFGGLGLGLLDAAVVARAWGAATIPGPWLATVIAAEAIRLAGTPGVQGHWLPRLAAGEVVLTLATRRPGGAFDVPGAACSADGSRVSGVAAYVDYAHVADGLITATADGRLWVVDPSAPGVSIERVDGLDRTTRQATVRFDRVAAEELATGALATVYRAGAVLVANDLVGVARSALDRTLAYVKQREQFGRPIGSFQAIKHALADLHVGVTMAEHGSLYAAHAVDIESPDAPLAASVAKAKSSDVARDATAAMIQYLGGIGYTWEHDAHIAFKRASREQYLFGDGPWHRDVLASELLASVAEIAR